MIIQGYAAPFYIGFIGLHLVVIVTGVVFVRQVCQIQQLGTILCRKARSELLNLC